MLQPQLDEAQRRQRAARYRAAAAQKRQQCLVPPSPQQTPRESRQGGSQLLSQRRGGGSAQEEQRAWEVRSGNYASGGQDGQYYRSLVEASLQRRRRDISSNGVPSDVFAAEDWKQIEKDLPRTFAALTVEDDDVDEEALLPMLSRIIAAYIERGRTLCATSLQVGLAASSGGGAATSARGLLTGYPQGLNFLVGMNLLIVGAGQLHSQGEANPGALEEDAFWLTALLLEDVLDPDFFGAEVRGNLQMAYIGGLGLRSLIVELAEGYCPAILDALGPETFSNILGVLLDHWVLSLFAGCLPHRLLAHLWEHLLLPSPYQPELHQCGRVPLGLATIAAFALGCLKCCGEERFAGGGLLTQLRQYRLNGMPSADLSLEACELVQQIRDGLLAWPSSQDTAFMSAVTQILVQLAENHRELWDKVRIRKQRIADCAGNCDEQLLTLARRTHFTIAEIRRLREEVESLSPKWQKADMSLDLQTFREVVRIAVPEFPTELCGRLFCKLDAFNVGRLAFVPRQPTIFASMCRHASANLGRR
eukprot:TRINITY_DN63777_c0_g1_i2.p1 TRINITY_DN63777_c0_g1~~TRINITY_DN63777_c0_g1_i2.p1  ORF type:complete len:534 (+),score=129.74 TRINITY_DN63777_c0_g1_i2:126-1727(+)